jgi:hypothetical protein
MKSTHKPCRPADAEFRRTRRLPRVLARGKFRITAGFSARSMMRELFPIFAGGCFAFTIVHGRIVELNLMPTRITSAG